MRSIPALAGDAGGSGGGGSIPTDVGRPGCRRPKRRHGKVYPRVGGATPSQCDPRPRGDPVRLPGQFSIRVYPRVRRGDRRVNPGARALPWYIPALAGGALRLKPTIEETSGPSPRLRGSALWGVALLRCGGLSPELGGCSATVISIVQVIGPSPRLRGCRQEERNVAPEAGSIPALAGGVPFGGSSGCSVSWFLLIPARESWGLTVRRPFALVPFFWV